MDEDKVLTMLEKIYSEVKVQNKMLGKIEMHINNIENDIERMNINLQNLLTKRWYTINK